jgi:hypothetical protein
MANQKEPTLAEEAGLPESWRAVDAAPIIPSGAPGRPNQMAPFFSGTISPQQQHDSVFTGTKYGSHIIPILPLMPLPISAQPTAGSAIQSGSTTTINTTTNAVAGGPNGAVQLIMAAD